MAEDASAEQPTQKIRRMPESYAHRRGAGRPRRGGRAGRGRREGHQSGGRGRGDKLKGLPPIHPSDPGDHDPIDYELPVAAGVHLDLNEPVFDLSHVFMALGGTPPSAAHVPGESWEVPFMEHAHLPTPPASPAPAEQPDEPAVRERARKAPRRRGCGTEGHM
ncbi:hypothetical protein PIB30_008072 [Stylosanthes scabra]|uniref:Uncharacterized protein n=1 Tax=Stylosanthes scabra TaxID=79078 RepID=A0ABU6W474_9FABA|nr:hypothetical protein [Stylosanthes scabra]